MNIRRNIVRKHAIAYAYWLQSLHVTGYPKRKDGKPMSHFELYSYWDKKVNKTPYLVHASTSPLRKVGTTIGRR